MNQLLVIEGKELLSRVPLHEQVTEHLTGFIISGELSAGTHLTEEFVANSFSVSRPTVSESLRSLVKRSLVEKAKDRSAYVAAITEEDFQDLLIVRKVSEIAVLDTLLETPDLLDADALQELQAEIRILDAGETMDDNEVIARDIDFHKKLAAITKSPHIASVQDSHIHALHLGLRNLSKQPEPGILARDHSDLLNGIQYSDGHLAMRALKSHIRYFKAL